MNKIFFIILLFAGIVLGVLLLWYFFLRIGEPAQEVPTNVGLPIAPQYAVPASDSKPIQGQQLTLVAPNGGTVTVLNFLDDPETVADPNNSGYYNMGYSVGTSPYLITYIASTQYFNIVLLQEPIGQTRELAEQYLKQHLGISNSDLCRLNYTIGAPTFVSGFYGGASLGFSFCLGATKLPE